MNDLEHKEAKKYIKKIQNNKKKKETTTTTKRQYKEPLGQLKHSNIHITGVPEGKQREQEIGNLLGKTMKEKFLSLVKEIDVQVQEAQRIPNKMEIKRPTPRHIIS